MLKLLFLICIQIRNIVLPVSSIMLFPGRFHPESNGPVWLSGWGVGGTGVVLASYFPSHVTEVWITFKTHVTALWLCAVWQLQRKRH